jgi:hypothetical protein
MQPTKRVRTINRSRELLVELGTVSFTIIVATAEELS